jgi:hypothetical protein
MMLLICTNCTFDGDEGDGNRLLLLFCAIVVLIIYLFRREFNFFCPARLPEQRESE